MDVLDRKAIAAHVLRHLAEAQARGRLVRLDELAVEIGVRRKDVREIVSRLHAEGYVDAQRLKVTMTGFLLASSMRGSPLKAVRNVPEAKPRAEVA
jgi:DNA-binding IscR family transcriptional regulator